MALRVNGRLVGGVNNIPSYTQEQYDALSVKPEFWICIDKDYLDVPSENVSYNDSNVKDTLDNLKDVTEISSETLATNIILTRFGKLRLLSVYVADTTGVTIPSVDRPPSTVASTCIGYVGSAPTPLNMVVTANGEILAGLIGQTPTTTTMRGQCLWFVS